MELGRKRKTRIFASVSPAQEGFRAKFRRRGKPLIIAFASWLCWALTTFILFRWFGEQGLLLALLLLGGLAFLGLAYMLFQFRRELWRQRKQDLDKSQRDLHYLQELIWLSARITIRRPLPFPLFQTGYEAGLEVLNAAWKIIVQERPRRVLELGSGLSSLVMAYALEANGHGELLAVEDGASYASKTRALLTEHGLSERARVIDAPLEQVKIDGETHHWYALTNLCPEPPIDFLFVDGPAGSLAPMIRYPALPILHKCLADKAHILLDDTDREQENLVVQRWLETFPDIQVCDSGRFRDSGFTVLQVSRQEADSS